MPEYGKRLRHNEDKEGITRYTLAYPELPPEVSKLIEGDGDVEIPDYSKTNLDELEDGYDPTASNTKDQSSTFVQTYANQGGYDAELDWNADKSRLFHDTIYTQNALLRRAAIAGAKGAVLGMGLGGLVSLAAFRYMTFTHTLPISFHVYSVGGLGFMVGGMNMVHQAKRYKEYIGFKQTGVGNPEMIGLKDAKNQMADWMSSAYSPEYVEQWRESEQAESVLQNQMAGIRR